MECGMAASRAVYGNAADIDYSEMAISKFFRLSRIVFTFFGYI